MFKYADDPYLLVPSVNSHLIPHELQHVSEWAAYNILNLNISKSSEIIFTPSYQRRKTPLPATIPGIIRSDHITILGVVFSSTLKFSQHVVYILSKAATTIFALRTQRVHGMAQASLHDICKARLITQITYTSPAWNGFLTVADRNRLQSIVTKAKTYQPANYDSFDQLCANADEKLFLTCVTTLTTSFVKLLPSVKCSGYNLQSRRHNCTLPNNNTTLISNNFINRMFFVHMC